jgi:hypothetical protein
MANINAPVCILLEINVAIGADIIRVSMIRLRTLLIIVRLMPENEDAAGTNNVFHFLRRMT